MSKFFKPSLKTRVLSALLAAGLLVATGYWAGAQGLADLSLLVLLVGAWEYSQLVFPSPRCPAPLRWLFLLGVLIIVTTFIFNPQFLLSSLALVIVSFLSLSLALTRNQAPLEELLRTLTRSATGFLYAVILPLHAIFLLQLEGALAWFAMMLLMVFACDTFAYFGGKWAGKTPLMPDISPKKTMEGSLSGVLGSLMMASLFWFFYFHHFSLLSLLTLGLFVAISAQFGDLFASLLKRVAQVKDSGKLMPGHGGILDRLDGVYFAAPLVYFWALTH